MAVADSSALIWLAKAGVLRVLRDLYGEVYVPAEVYEEVVTRGLEDGYPDAHQVEAALGEGWLKVHPATPSGELRAFMGRTGLHGGEAAAIRLALSLGTPLLMDEREGRAVARAFGVATIGSLRAILTALHRGQLTNREARDAVDSMTRKGFWVEPALLTRIYREIDSNNPPPR